MIIGKFKNHSMYSYKRVKFAITHALSQKRWGHSEAIPSEPLLAKKFKVSVGTVRRAVNELVAENILIREQGRGTFVISHTEDYMLNVFFRIESKSGKRELPKSNLISFNKVKPSKFVSNLLKINTNEKIYKIKTILTFNGSPAIVDEIYLPEKIFPNLEPSFFSERNGTLFKLFQERYGVTVFKTKETVVAECPSDEIARLLNKNSKDPILKITRVAYAYKDTVVDLRIRFVDSSNYRYFNTLGGG